MKKFYRVVLHDKNEQVLRRTTKLKLLSRATKAAKGIMEGKRRPYGVWIEGQDGKIVDGENVPSAYLLNEKLKSQP